MKRIAAVGAGLLLGVAVTTFFASGFVALTRPGETFFCSRCHPRIVQRWQASTHAETRCVDCHSRWGVLGFWSENLYAAQIGAMAVTGRWRAMMPLRTQVSDAGCLKCHEGRVAGPRTGRVIAGLDDRLAWQGTTFTHRQLFAAGYKCTYCHSTLVEGDLVPPGSRTYPHLPPEFARAAPGLRLAGRPFLDGTGAGEEPRR